MALKRAFDGCPYDVEEPASNMCERYAQPEHRGGIHIKRFE
jgi:hypothetical protein